MRKSYYIAITFALILGIILGLYFYYAKKLHVDLSARKPSFALSHLKAKGYILLQSKKKQEALVFLRKAAELDPNDQKLRSLLNEIDPKFEKSLQDKATK